MGNRRFVGTSFLLLICSGLLVTSVCTAQPIDDAVWFAMPTKGGWFHMPRVVLSTIIAPYSLRPFSKRRNSFDTNSIHVKWSGMNYSLGLVEVDFDPRFATHSLEQFSKLCKEIVGYFDKAIANEVAIAIERQFDSKQEWSVSATILFESDSIPKKPWISKVTLELGDSGVTTLRLFQKDFHLYATAADSALTQSYLKNRFPLVASDRLASVEQVELILSGKKLKFTRKETELGAKNVWYAYSPNAVVSAVIDGDSVQSVNVSSRSTQFESSPSEFQDLCMALASLLDPDLLVSVQSELDDSTSVEGHWIVGTENFQVKLNREPSLNSETALWKFEIAPFSRAIHYE